LLYIKSTPNCINTYRANVIAKYIDDKIKVRLRRHYDNLNPADLKRKIAKLQDKLIKLNALKHKVRKETTLDENPNAVVYLKKDMDDMLVFFDYPEKIWIKIRTTNIIERSFREVRRRVRPMTCFENDASVAIIIFGVMSHLNKSWKDKPIKEFTFTQKAWCYLGHR